MGGTEKEADTEERIVEHHIEKIIFTADQNPQAIR